MSVVLKMISVNVVVQVEVGEWVEVMNDHNGHDNDNNDRNNYNDNSDSDDSTVISAVIIITKTL